MRLIVSVKATKCWNGPLIVILFAYLLTGFVLVARKSILCSAQNLISSGPRHYKRKLHFVF